MRGSALIIERSGSLQCLRTFRPNSCTRLPRTVKRLKNLKYLAELPGNVALYEIIPERERLDATVLLPFLVTARVESAMSVQGLEYIFEALPGLKGIREPQHMF